MAHPAVPWVDAQIAIAPHKSNVYLDLSGYSPKYFPPQLVRALGPAAAHQGAVRHRLPLHPAGPLAEGLRTLDLDPECAADLQGERAAGARGELWPWRERLSSMRQRSPHPDQHPNLPVTPDQLAAAAVPAHQAGAQAVHMHPKTADGVDSLHRDVVGAAVQAVRAAVPGLPLGVTTGFWALPDADARLRAVEGWTVLPDFASLNWHEPGSEELAHVLLEKGTRRRGRSVPRRGGGVVGPIRYGRSTACG